MDGLAKVIDRVIDYEKFKKSNIDFGLVTTHFPSFKGKYVTKKDMTEKNLKSYLLATASCFPAFKPTKIGKEYYVDGGYFDNIPYKLALDMGADNLIIVDLGAIGITKNLKKIKVPHIIIKPKVKLGNLLLFEKDYTKNYAKLGYNDTLKIYNKLDGNKYTFKKDSLNRNYERNINRFMYVLNKYEKQINNKNIKKLFNKDNEKYYDEILENLMDVVSIDPTKIYRTSLANVLVKNEFLSSDYKKYDSIRKVLKLSTNNTSYDLVSFMYNLISNNKSNIKRYINLFPKAFLCAVYLYSIINRR